MFAVLDDYLDCSDDEGQSKCSQASKDDQQSTTSAKIGTTNNGNAYVRGTGYSKFAWILPATPTISSNNVPNNSFEAEKKRKGRKRDTIGKTMYKKLRGLPSGDCTDAKNEDLSCCSDTTVAVQALSALFLSPPPPAITAKVRMDDSRSNDNTPLCPNPEETTARIEDARILLSLIDHGENKKTKVNETAATPRSPTSYFWKSP